MNPRKGKASAIHSKSESVGSALELRKAVASNLTHGYNQDALHHHEVIQVRNMEFHTLQAAPLDQGLESLKDQLNDISAISIEKTFIKSEKAAQFETRLTKYLDLISLDQIQKHFIEPQELAPGFLKGAKALCYISAIFNPARATQRLKFSKLPEIKQFLLKNQAFFANLSHNVLDSLHKIYNNPHDFLTTEKQECLKILKTQIFGKLIQENS